jgi:hypothetical protein
MANKDREALAAQHPDAWIPVSAGEILEGAVIDLNVGYSDLRQANYPILTIVDDNGVEVKVHAYATALHNEIYTKQPIPGERVTITYYGQGEAKIKGQNPPEIYRLRVHNRSPEAYARMYNLLQPRVGGPQLPPPRNGSQSGTPQHAGELTT